MYSRIFPNKVISQIVSVAPDPAYQPITMARNVVEAMKSIQAEAKAEGRLPVCYVGDIAKRISSNPTPHRVGRTLRDIGLTTVHNRGGNIVSWNEKQLRIIEKALGTFPNE